MCEYASTELYVCVRGGNSRCGIWAFCLPAYFICIDFLPAVRASIIFHRVDTSARTLPVSLPRRMTKGPLIRDTGYVCNFARGKQTRLHRVVVVVVVCRATINRQI